MENKKCWLIEILATTAIAIMGGSSTSPVVTSEEKFVGIYLPKDKIIFLLSKNGPPANLFRKIIAQKVSDENSFRKIKDISIPNFLVLGIKYFVGIIEIFQKLISEEPNMLR